MEDLTITERLEAAADRFLKWAYNEPFSGPPVISIPRHPDNIDALLLEASAALLSSAEAREEAERNAQGWHRAVEAICTIAGVSCALGASEAVEAVRAALQSAEARAREAEALWAWLSEQENLSLEYYRPVYGDDDDDAVEWRVHRKIGNINDRDWEMVGAGPTALAAVQAARQALGASHG